MKKLLLLLLALLTCLCFVACGDDEGDGGHEHSFVYDQQIMATCTTDSYHRYVCECGEENRISVATAPGHDFGGTWTLEAEPTLTEAGLLTTKCLRCQEGKEQVLPALNETDYQYSPASGVTCSTPTSHAVDYYCYSFNGREYDFTVQLEVPEHDYQPDPNESYYIEHCTVCGKTKEGTEREHEYVLDDYKAICSVCGHESGREVFKVTATEGTTLVGTLSNGEGSERLYFDEPVTELFVYHNTYVIAKAPEGTYYDGIGRWTYTSSNGSNSVSGLPGDEYDLRIYFYSDYSIHAKMNKKQALISVQGSYGLKDSEGNSVSPESNSNDSTSYYNVNLGDTYTLVPGTNTETSVFLGWIRGTATDAAELFTNGEIVITEGTTDAVVDNNKFRVVGSSLTALMPFTTYHDYILVSGYLYNTETLTVTKYDVPTRLPLNEAGNMDIQFLAQYHDVNALYVQNVNEDGETLARGLYYDAIDGVYSLNDSILDFRNIKYTVSPETVTVDGVEYCEFKFIASGGKHTNLNLYWGKDADWMYQGSTFANAQFYKTASPEDYLDVSDISLSIYENQNYSTITVSLNSLPTKEELVAYYKAFISEYQSYYGMYIYSSKSCAVIDRITTEYQLNSNAEGLYTNSNKKLYMWLTDYYCCQLQFSLDTTNSALVITLTKIYKN